MKKSLLLFLVSFSFLAQAQNEPYIKDFVQKIIPPTPTAFEFSNFGNIPFNGSTGGFNYSVPIYTIKSGDISLPISVNYFTNGVQVDALSGLVGTNWSLSAGGAISRVIKDWPDEGEANWFPATIDPYGDEEEIRNLARDSSWDSEQDWFSFSVNGISGSFFFDENLVLHLSSNDHLVITYEPFTSGGGISKFTITDENGFRYIFGDGANFIESSISLEECSTMQIGSATSWFLKEIISPTNNSISFAYEDNDLLYKTNLINNYALTGVCNYPQQNFSPSTTVCLNRNSSQSKVISLIQFKNNQVVFEYNENREDEGGKSLKTIKIKTPDEIIKQVDFDYDMVSARTVPINSVLIGDNSLTKRLFFKKITLNSNLQTDLQEKYQFDYYEPDELPIRLSYSKDKFGYNNGTLNQTPYSNTILTSSIANIAQPYNTQFLANLEVNPSVVHYGALQKITYPTGGYSIIEYEPNSDVEMEDVMVPSTYTINPIKYCDTSTSPTLGTFEFVSNGTPLNFQAIANTQGPTCNTGINNPNYNIKVYKDNVVIFNEFAAYGTSLYSSPSVACVSTVPSPYNHQPICTVSGSTYKIVISLEKTGTYGQVVIKYNNVATQVPKTIFGGGVRVKNISDYTDDQHSYNKKNYFYNQLSEYPSNPALLSAPYNSTMIHSYEPKFYQVNQIMLACNPSGLVLDGGLKITFNSSSYTAGYISRQATNYSAITEIYENDGLKNGATEKLFVANPVTPGQMILGGDIYSVPASNYGDFFKDLIREETVYDNNNQQKSKKIFNYSLHASNYLTSMIARKNFEDPPAGWLDPLINFSVWSYKNYYGIVKLDQVSEIENYDGRAIEKITNNNYGSAPFFELQSKVTTNSQNEIITTEYKYPFDLVGTEQAPFMQNLLNVNRIGEPIITAAFNGSTKISETHIKYGNSTNTSHLLLPTEMHSNKNSSGIDVALIENRKIQFKQYDDKGNIQEYQLENGSPVSIIWGYDKQYPIAKIEGSTYGPIASYASTLETESNNGTLTETSFSGLQTMPNTMVTGYVYRPLIGVISITDPKGVTIFYDYDASGKLKSVKDNFGRILSENEYHFKPQP